MTLNDITEEQRNNTNYDCIEYESFEAGFYASNFKTRLVKYSLIMTKIIHDEFILYLNNKTK